MSHPSQEALDGARIAVIMRLPQRQQIIVGKATTADDDTIRIDVADEPGSPSLFIPQHHWQTHSCRDDTHGCDYKFEMVVE